MMKRSILLFAALCAMPLGAEITREGDGAVKLDRETRALSFQLLLRDKLVHFAADGFPAGKAKIKDVMQRDMSHYVRRGVARQKTEKLFRAELDAALRQEIDELIRSTVGKLNAADQAALDAELRALTNQKVKKFFPAAFDEARNELAEAERKSQIFTAIYPSGKELENLDDANLTTILLQRFTAPDQRPVMEENRPFIQKNLVAPVIAAGRKQQKIQSEILPRIHIPQTLWQVDETAQFLQKELRTATMRELPDPNENFIEFPSLQSQLRLRAQNIIYERLAVAMPDALDDARYANALKTEPQLHATWQKSVVRCREMMLADTLDVAVTAIHAPDALSRSITANDAKVQKLFTDAATKKFQRIRNDYAEKQIKRIWKNFDEWLPRLEETELFVQRGEKELPAVAGRPAPQEPVFAETEIKITDAVRKKFLAEAARLKAQQKCVDTIYREVADECSALDRKYRTGDVSFWQKFFGTAPDAMTLEEIIKVYEGKVEKSTTSPLFPSVRHEIEIRARAILQQIQEAASKPKDAKPQSFTIAVTGQKDADFTLTMGSWQKRFVAGDDPAAAITAELKQRSVKNDMPVILVLEVANPALTYRRIAELREALQQLLPEATVQDNYVKEK